MFMDADSILGKFEDNALAIDKFTPLFDNLLVQLAEQETSTSTGIALAGLEEEEANSGAVVAVGSGVYAANGDLLPPSVSPGDSVMYSRYAGGLTD